MIYWCVILFINPVWPIADPWQVICEVDNKPLTHAECRMVWRHKVDFYKYLRNQEVSGFCRKRGES